MGSITFRVISLCSLFDFKIWLLGVRILWHRSEVCIRHLSGCFSSWVLLNVTGNFFLSPHATNNWRDNNDVCDKKRLMKDNYRWKVSHQYLIVLITEIFTLEKKNRPSWWMRFDVEFSLLELTLEKKSWMEKTIQSNNSQFVVEAKI
jgi:hypothetical protein